MHLKKDIQERFTPLFTLLSRKIRTQGFTERQVAEALSWERDHIGQLKANPENLRVAELLSILDAIHVTPKAFFVELYEITAPASSLYSEVTEVSTLAEGLANVLVEKQWITAGELARAVATCAGERQEGDDELKR